MPAFVLKATGGDATESGGALVKPDEVRRAAAVLFDPDFGVQIQALPSARWITCDGNDLEGIAKAANELAPGQRGVYWTLCPCPRGMAAAMKSSAAVQRRWLLIDVDVVRERDTNSTDAEHATAQEKTQQIADALAGEGWPAPLIADSGNGWHLYYRVDLPNDKNSQVLLREVIKALAERYDDTHCAIDRKVHDARRISKLPGTLTRKGPSAPDRPHRWARLVMVPDKIEIVTAEQLRELGAPANQSASTHEGNGLAVPQSCMKFKPGIDRRRAYAQAALEREVANVVLAPSQHGNEVLYTAALKMGGLIAAGAMPEAEAESKLLFAATANGRRTVQESMASIASGISNGKAKPRDLSFLDAPPVTPASPAEKSFEWPTIWRVDTLIATTFPPPKWAVPGLLSEGISILAGKPKLGKSWLALNLGLTIAAGGRALGSAQTVAGDVLYLSLEDRLRRVKDRAIKVLTGLVGQGITASRRLQIAVEWPRQDRGGMDALKRWLDEADNPRLGIIDVWAKFKTPSLGRRSAYDEDYEAMSAAKAVFDQGNCSCLFVHHCRKGKADDVMEEVSGTLGLGGSADGVLVLARTRSENDAVLHVTGRDVEEQQIALLFDPQTCCWTNQGDAKGVTSSKIMQKLIDLLKTSPNTSFFPSELALMLTMNKDTVKSYCWRMADKGLLKRSGGKYSWPANELPAGCSLDTNITQPLQPEVITPWDIIT